MAEKIKDKEKGTGTVYPIILDTPVRNLPVKLTDGEIIAKCRELAETVQELTREEERQKNEKDQMKARMAELDSKMHNLSLVVSKGEEYRSIDVELRLQENGQVDEVRKDTGEVVITREITRNERQMAARLEIK